MPWGADGRQIYATDEAGGWRSGIRDDEKSMDLDKFPKLGSDRAEDVSKVGRPKFRPLDFQAVENLNAKDAKKRKTQRDAKEILLRVLCEHSFASFAFKFFSSSRLTL
jgi:hypothetical protein